MNETMSSRILIVDDTPANIRVLSSALKQEGYQISVATSGLQALAEVQRLHPDVILLDVMMPEMDGFETCRRLKESHLTSDIPIIFLTARTETTDIVHGFEAGAVDYVAKPFNSCELLARVKTHLTVDQLRRSLAAKNAELARAHELVRRAFGRYVSEEVAESLLRTPEALQLGGEEREVTILMSDLRGFTAMAARLTAPEVIEILNLYLESMVDVIARFEGTIDEIIGDAILVIFGAPVRCEDHAGKAAACGLSMQLAMAEVNGRLRAKGAEMGIGIHTGRVVVGNIGSLRRTKYAAVGSNVNLAGRIESFTTGGQVLISESTREQIQSPLRIDGQFQVEPKGAAHRLKLYEVGSIGAPFNISLPSHFSLLVPLPVPVPIHFTVLEEKFVGRTIYDGRLNKVSGFEAEIEAVVALVPLTNLKIEIQPLPGTCPGGEIYAKVVSSQAGSPEARLRFTSLSPELKAWVQQMAAGASAAEVPSAPVLGRSNVPTDVLKSTDMQTAAGNPCAGDGPTTTGTIPQP
jgi:class 3 adenylate cyclase/CheY-like chemotaxis protein